MKVNSDLIDELRRTMDRSWWWVLIVLILTFVVFECSGLDLLVQDHWYDSVQQAWSIDAKAFWPRVFAYTGPKVIAWLIGIYALMQAVVSNGLRDRMLGCSIARVHWWVVFLTMVFAPLGVATLKATTNVHTPSQIKRYGGKVEYVKVCEKFPEGQKPAQRGRGFPAGHASGGFALFALCGLTRTSRGFWLTFFGVLVFGWIMGWYQMAKGAHYLSHTLISVMWCWLIFLGMRRAMVCVLERKGVTDPT